jgi:leucyl/phenylalanyl-tRNA---protein transferase
MSDRKLNAALLERAYRNGYFPMADPKTAEVFWYRPDPRAILPIEGLRIARSLKKRLRTAAWKVTYNQHFIDVMKACGERKEGTWMNDEFFAAYGDLHQQGKAHSVEILGPANQLVGGVYGVALGGGFFAESMFHRQTDASKAALYYLVDRLKACGFTLLEVQFLTPHLESLGAVEIADAQYVELLGLALQKKPLDFSRSL